VWLEPSSELGPSRTSHNRWFRSWLAERRGASLERALRFLKEEDPCTHGAETGKKNPLSSIGAAALGFPPLSRLEAKAGRRRGTRSHGLTV
jgi:hypothetical protein